MWIRICASLLGLALGIAFAQNDTIMPIQGCIQYKITFTDSAIDENCLFYDQLNVEAINGSSFVKGQCNEKGGQYYPGYATTYSQTCPGAGYYYTGCCSVDDCQTKADIAQAYCEGAGLMSVSFCDTQTNTFYYGGCQVYNDWNYPYSPRTASNNSDNAQRDYYNTQAILNQLDDNRKSIRENTQYLYQWMYANSQLLSEQNDISKNGFSVMADIGAMQMHALQNLQNQTIKARFEQSGILGNIELIGEEQLALLDSLNRKEYTVNNDGVISAINANHDQLMNATGTGGETFDTLNDLSDEYEQDTGEYQIYNTYYRDSAGGIVQQISDSVMPNYDSLSNNIIGAFTRFQDNESCPFTPIQVQNWINGGQDFEVDMGICEMTLIGNIKVIEFMRTLINLFVYMSCAFIIHRTIIRALSGKDVV